MANATAARDTKRIGNDVLPRRFGLPMTAAKKIFQGTMVGIDAAGNCLSAGDAAAVKVVGVYTGQSARADNSSGLAGAVVADPIETGTYPFANSAAGDAITGAHIGRPCYVVDDQTVALTDNNGARLFAGTIVGVSTFGVHVSIVPISVGEISAAATSIENAAREWNIPVILSKIANGAVLARFKPQAGGRIKKVQAYVIDPATTGAKAATLTPAIGGTPTTGGAVALTSANCTPIGAGIDGTAVTAANTFAAGDEITLVGSGVTAFVEGEVVVVIECA